MASEEKNDTVVFVCEFGSKKSLLAACYLNRLAEAQGLNVRAVSRGLTPDSVVPDGIRRALLAEGIDIGAFRPEPLSASDVEQARVVVSFSEDLGALSPIRAPDRVWADLPALSDNYAVARDAIFSQVQRLVAELAG